MEIEEKGLFWNDKHIITVRLGGVWYALDGWNGEKYCDCFAYKDKCGYARADHKVYLLKPINEGVPDEFGDFWLTTTGYEIEEE